LPKLAANLSLMFREVNFLERFAAAADAGFSGVECQFPYDHDAADVRARLQDHGLTQVLLNLPAGNWGAGERGIACHPDRINDFKASVDQAIRYANQLDCKNVHALAGITPQGVDGERLRATYVENLKYATERLSDEDITLLIEPINTRDIPGYYLRGTEQALDLMTEVGSDNIALQYDIYHMHIMEGDLALTIEQNLGRIAHIQLADDPGRHEPGTGNIAYALLLPFLDEIGYSGWVGCEYMPVAATLDGLGWADAYLKNDHIRGGLSNG